MTILTLGPTVELRNDVKTLYEKYTDRISRGTLMMLSPPGGEKTFYVYEWFTKDTGKVFYVGKGTGKRYRHIISDMARPRGEEYQELQSAFGIDFRFIANGLTSREAEIYELCLILQRTDAGEVLLQSAHNPQVTKHFEALKQMKDSCASRNFIPQIIVSDYRKRYFQVEPPPYDQIDISRLNVTFIASLDNSALSTIKEMEYAKNLVTQAGGKVFSTIAKKAQAVVEFDNIDYDKYMKHKRNGLLVYHSFDLIHCLK